MFFEDTRSWKTDTYQSKWKWNTFSEVRMNMLIKLHLIADFKNLDRSNFNLILHLYDGIIKRLKLESCGKLQVSHLSLKKATVRV